MSETVDEMDIYKYALMDVVDGLIAKAGSISGSGAYDDGRKMAYFEALQAISSVVDESGIDRAEIGIDRFDFAGLVGLKKAA